MHVLYTALDGRDAIVVPDFQYILLPENLRYTYAVSSISKRSDTYAKRDLNTKIVTLVSLDELPDPVKALIVLYDI